jgi:ABC-type sugar transport system permease subunit
MRSQPSRTSDGDDLNRRLYIDGISYVLRGLPTDLTREEALTIRTAVPASILPAPQEDSALIQQPTQQPHQPTSPPTLLHRAVSTTTFYTLLALTLLIPHLQTLFATLCALDARHQFSTRFLAQTSFLLRMLAAQAVAVLAMAWGANDGALRHACRDFGVWVLRDVCGGMDEGVGRAVVNLRLEEKEARK